VREYSVVTNLFVALKEYGADLEEIVSKCDEANVEVLARYLCSRIKNVYT
jgi:hypothetical protein